MSSCVYMTLKKHYPVLLDRLYAAGINGKCWRLLKNWYEGAQCRVKTQTGDLLRPFVIETGVKQGSVLSPTLFLMVLNLLLSSLQQAGIGPSVNNFFAGGFLHADDIRTLSTSIASLDTQISIVRVFAEKNFLKLNIRKCEIIPFSCNSVPHGHESINGLPVVSTAKCLGYWWGRDLFAPKLIEENIKKARNAFFSYGSIGAFQGDLNPLSSKSIINTCVMPVLLFDSEN